ncbi:MAG TPA: transposase [Opitutaceae bacterium]
MSEPLERLLAGTASFFASEGDHQKACTHLLAGLLNLGRHTITGTLTTAGRQHHDWSAQYRALQRLPTEPLYGYLQEQTLARTEGPWVIAVDDSAMRKTGRKIPGCGWRRDPLSPAFHVNFCWGQRVLQCSAAIPASDGSARLVPIDWTEAPLPKKPAPRASKEEWSNYQEARRQANLNQVTLQRFAHLRTKTDRPIHFVVDGRFTNRTVLRGLPEATVVIGRIRKDTKLYAIGERQAGGGRPRRYGAVQPTPEQLRVDHKTPWQPVRAFAAEAEHLFKIKCTEPVMARIRGVSAPVRVIVIAPLGYRLRRGGRILYRQPAYLLCTDPDLPLERVLQQYLWRWDIEVNFRDEKCLLGVSEAQLRNPHAVRRQPAAAVAAYAVLLLAAHDAYGHNGQPPSVPLPRWRQRQPPRRPTTSRLLSQLRIELWSHCLRQSSLSQLRSSSLPHQNSDKLQPNLPPAVFYARN